MKYYFVTYFSCNTFGYPKLAPESIVGNLLLAGKDVDVIFKTVQDLNKGGGTRKDILTWKEITAEEYNIINNYLGAI